MVKSKKNLLLVILSVVFALTLISFVAVRPVKAEGTSVITMKETASIRLDADGAGEVEGEEHLGKDGKNGLRFTAYVNEDVTLDEDTYAGIFVARGEVSVEDMKALTPAGDVIDVKAEKFDPTVKVDGCKVFNAVIYNMPSKAYTQDLTAMAYVYDGGEYTYSENVITRSLVQVANSSILKDNLVPEDLVLYKEFIDKAEINVSVNGVTFDETNTMDIEVMHLDTITIELGVPNVTPTINVSDSALAVNGNVITANEITENSTIIITLGSKTYTVNVEVGAFVDKTIASNVLADFDEAGYADYVSVVDNEGTLTMLPGQSAIDENVGATSGIVKFYASKGYDRINVMFQKPIKLSEIDALYLRYRTNTEATGSQFRYYLLDTEGNAFSTTLLTIKDSTVDDWTIIKIPVSALSSYDQNVEIGGIYLYWIAGTHYVDEIGYVKGAWVDQDVAENVVADFNEEQYLFNVVSGNSSGTPGAVKILTGDKATAVGATSGVLSLEAMSNWNYLDIKVPNPFKLSEVDGIVLKVNYSDYANLRIALYDANGYDLRPYTIGDDGNPTYTLSFSEGSGCPKIVTIVTGSQPSYLYNTYLTSYNALTNEKWETIYIPSYLFTKVYDDNREVATIRLYNNSGSVQKLYVDEISAPKVNDVNANALVAEDFNGLDVVGKAWTEASSNKLQLDYYTGSFGSLYGADSGIIAMKYSSYFNIHMQITPTYSLGDVGGIYIRMKHDNAEKNIGQIRLYLYDEEGNAIEGGNGKYFRNYDSTKYPDALSTDWVTVELSYAQLTKYYTDTTTKIAKIVINSTSGGTVCVDEIGFLPKA